QVWKPHAGANKIIVDEILTPMKCFQTTTQITIDNKKAQTNALNTSSKIIKCPIIKPRIQSVETQRNQRTPGPLLNVRPKAQEKSPVPTAVENPGDVSIQTSVKAWREAIVPP